MYWNTVTPLLRSVLESLMREEIFQSFRLVGGTCLSIQFGHRESVDIDLFTDIEYDSFDFEKIDQYFRKKYSYVTTNRGLPTAIGKSWYVGHSISHAIKVDVYYTEPFIRPVLETDQIRLASVEVIIAMKLEVLSNGGRKKDFWDLHLLHDKFSIARMIDFHQERYPFGHSPELLKSAFIDFNDAENDFEPVCLLGKYWQLIKLDFVEWMDLK